MTRTIWLLMALSLLLAACSGQPTAPPQIDWTPVIPGENDVAAPTNAAGLLPPVDPAAVSGDIITAGSSTVFPLTERMAERFEEEGFVGQITIDLIGTGAGFERFCVSGDTDISNASRPIKSSELESCRRIGREPIEFRVGTDALAVVVSAENDFVDSLTLEQLALVFSTAETWADVNPAWPAEPIRRYSPGTDSGTFDYFVEEVFDKNEEPLLTAANLNMSEDDNVLVQGAEGSPYAIGYMGYAYYEENAGRLRAVAIEGIEPSQETVNAGTYPLARPLYIYSDAQIMREKPQVAAFINYYLTYVNEEVLRVGYFPPSDADLQQSRQNWLQAMGLAQPVALPPVDPAAVSGDIITAGSSTVFPLTERMAERFEEEGFVGQITIDLIGTGAGFERFCVSGDTDISNASRPIKSSELESCRRIGREPIEFRVGTDALAVVVSAENDFVDSLTLEQLALVFSTAETWADVNPSWPAEPIRRYSPGTDSGTFDYFVEEVFDKNEEPLLTAATLNMSEDDNVLVQGVEGSPYAIGYMGYAYYEENAGRLRAVAIEGIEPSQETVNAGTYPLARPLYIYSDAQIMREKPQVAAFINYYLTYVNEEVLRVGYFPASDADLQQSRQNWLQAMGLAQPVALPPVDPAAVSGDIITAGSSTVFPLTERMAERFEEEGFVGQITIDLIGTGAGFERFCVSGDTDISNASRPIKSSELESCRRIGREPIEFRVGTDALAVVVSVENDFVDSLTLEQLALVFSTAETWADVNPSWPAEPIRRYSPGTDSGTFDYFVEEVFDKNEEPLLTAANLNMSEDDNVLVQGAEGSPYAIGYMGYAYYEENAGRLRAVAIEGIEPSQETVNAGTYPLARPLDIYSDAQIMREKPQVAAFINYYLTYVNEEVLRVGYFPPSDADLQQSRQNWLQAMGQSR